MENYSVRIFLSLIFSTDCQVFFLRIFLLLLLLFQFCHYLKTDRRLVLKIPGLNIRNLKETLAGTFPSWRKRFSVTKIKYKIVLDTKAIYQIVEFCLRIP